MAAYRLGNGCLWEESVTVTGESRGRVAQRATRSRKPLTPVTGDCHRSDIST